MSIKLGFAAFAEFMRRNKGTYVTQERVLVEVYDPTYGQLDPRTELIEYVSYDALCQAIDAFSKEFKL